MRISLGDVIKKRSTELSTVSSTLNDRLPTKKALLVGINKYAPELEADLRGCVNDVENMMHILIDVYRFMPDNIRILTDFRATKHAILDRLDWLLDNAMPRDELVFHYSGHGSQIRDREGDELDDRLDEIICQTNLDWDDPLKDDDLAEIFKKIPNGAYLTMICDSCHSGTMTRGLCDNPHPILPRYIEPPFDIKSRSFTKDPLEIRTIGKPTFYRNIEQNHVLLSGCKDHQTSADAYINGRYQGAFTWAFTEALRRNPNMNFRQAHKEAVDALRNKYSQTPQLSGADYLLDRKLFGGT